MNRRAILQSLAAAPALAGCSPFVKPRTTRLRLDMLARIAGVEHRAYTVFEIRWTKNLIVLPETGEWDWRRTGDALMLDLGSKGLLFGIWGEVVGSYKNSFSGESRQLFQVLSKYRDHLPDDKYKDGTLFDELAASTNTASLLKPDWPQLVYFSDVRNLQTATAMPLDFAEEVLGADMRIEDFTLRATREPISRGVQGHLPWWNQMGGNPLSLQRYNFVIDQLYQL